MKIWLFRLLVAGCSFAGCASAIGRIAPDPPRTTATPSSARSATATRLAGRAPVQLAASTPAACLADTSQADFASGIATNLDLDSSPDDAILFAASALDQQNAPIGSFGVDFSPTKWLAQLFKPGVSGTLAQVDLRLFCASCTGTIPDITVAIQGVTNSPSGPVLASTTIAGPANDTAAFVSVVFSPAPQLVAGQTYAIVLSSTGDLASGHQDAATDFAAGYAPGVGMQSLNSGSSWTQLVPDLEFKTYMRATFAASGDLVSSTKDGDPTLTGSPAWTTLSWNATTPANTSLRFQVAGSNSSSGPFDFVGPDGTAATYYETSGESLLQFTGSRYLQWRAFLATSDGTVTPTLHDATVCYYDGTPADISVGNDDGVTSAAAGTTVVYTVDVANAGPGDATGVSVMDAFPPGLSCTWTCDDAGGGTCTASGAGDIDESVDLPANTSIAYAATCSIPPDASGSISNAAAATFAGDGNLANNGAMDDDTLTVEGDLVVAIGDSRSKVQVGNILDYLIEVTNAGPSDVTATVSDVLPSQLTGGMWTCTPSGGADCAAGTGDTLADTATLPSGAKASYHYTAMVQGEDIDGMIVNMASADLVSGTDPQPTSNSATDTDAVVIFADGFE